MVIEITVTPMKNRKGRLKASDARKFEKRADRYWKSGTLRDKQPATPGIIRADRRQRLREGKLV